MCARGAASGTGGEVCSMGGACVERKTKPAKRWRKDTPHGEEITRIDAQDPFGIDRGPFVGAGRPQRAGASGDASDHRGGWRRRAAALGGITTRGGGPSCRGWRSAASADPPLDDGPLSRPAGDIEETPGPRLCVPEARHRARDGDLPACAGRRRGPGDRRTHGGTHDPGNPHGRRCRCRRNSRPGPKRSTPGTASGCSAPGRRPISRAPLSKLSAL